MRKLITIIGLSMLVSDLIGGERPWADIIKARSELAKAPTVKEIKRDGDTVLLEVKNNCPNAIAYFGYESGIQEWQKIQRKGRWMESRWDWCGTGKVFLEIAPGASAQLKIRFWDPKEQEQIWGIFYDAKDHNVASFILLVEEHD